MYEDEEYVEKILSDHDMLKCKEATTPSPQQPTTVPYHMVLLMMIDKHIIEDLLETPNANTNQTKHNIHHQGTCRIS